MDVRRGIHYCVDADTLFEIWNYLVAQDTEATRKMVRGLVGSRFMVPFMEKRDDDSGLDLET